MFPRFLVAVVVVLFLSFAEERAQSAPPQKYEPAGLNVPPPQPDLFEISIGFDYLRADDALARNMYGGDVSLFANINSWLAVGGEFIGGYGEQNHVIFRRTTTTFDENRLFYVGGARINVWRRDNFKIYGEALGGGAHGRVSALIFGIDRHASADGFAAVLGAGAEWKFTRRLAWRILETDYIPAHFNGQWENNFRVSTGLTFSLGTGW